MAQARTRAVAHPIPRAGVGVGLPMPTSCRGIGRCVFQGGAMKARRAGAGLLSLYFGWNTITWMVVLPIFLGA